MHTKNHENCSKIECFMSQKPLAPKFLSQTVDISYRSHFSYNFTLNNFSSNNDSHPWFEAF